MCIIYFIVATCFDLIRPSSGDLYEYKTHEVLYTVCTIFVMSVIFMSRS